MVDPKTLVGRGKAPTLATDAPGPVARADDPACLRGATPDEYSSKTFDPSRFIRPSNQNARLRKAIAEALDKQRRGANEPVSGEAWIEASQFSPLSSRNVLRRLVSRVAAQAERAARGEGPSPVVIFDLDHTVYDNSERMLSVLHNWTWHPAAREFNEARNAIRHLQRDQVCYGITDSVINAGVDEQQAAAITRSVLPLFEREFFNDHNTLLDEPYDGVLDAIQELVNAGAKIVFLTGRCEDEQGPGTRTVLGRDGMGVDDETFYLFMKPTKYKEDGSKLSDEEYKRSIEDELRAIGEVMGTLDNEPANVAVFSELFPDAMNIFVQSAWSNTPAEPKRGLYKLERFAADD